MKIFIAGNYSRNLVIFRLPVIQALVGRGHRVVAIGPEADPWVTTRLEQAGAKFKIARMSRASINPVHDFAYVWRLAALALREKPHVALTFTHKPNTFGATSIVLGSGAGVLLLIEGLGYSFIDVSSVRKKVAKYGTEALYRLAFAISAGALFLNIDDIGYFRKQGLLPARYPAGILDGIGVDLERFRFWPAPDNGFGFLMVARLLKTKGVLEYCEAAAEVKTRFPQVRFVLVGSYDPSHDGISADVLDAYIEQQVIQWVPESNEVERYYRECSVYVLPSYREGVPVTVLEAMATGRPVITTNAPGCRTTVTSGLDGVLVPIKDSAALRDAMMEMILAPERVRALGLAARETAERRFDARKLANSQADILEMISGRIEII